MIQGSLKTIYKSLKFNNIPLLNLWSWSQSEWLYPPYAAHIDDNGNIYARGAQDTKDVGIQYIEAIRKLKQDNCNFLRTVHITVMPGNLRILSYFINILAAESK